MQIFVEKHVADSSVCEMRMRLKGLPQLIHEYDEVQIQLELYDEDSEQHEHDRESFENTHSASDLRNLLNQLASNLKAIEALELKVPLHELLLSQLVLHRFDKQGRKEWEKLNLPRWKVKRILHKNHVEEKGMRVKTMATIEAAVLNIVL
ncbi:hypothetical protein PR048_008852 [Dryococelus australis]|uniref:Uncharacterized protein n=1 Tax=Dryococelus australis TaxID=614101 RepID=A0ABQ9HY96_9NEOP|nr:hypothetical protein PR048_008852 [Dryococelus australis]